MEGLQHLVSSAATDFRRNKVRTFLTSLGITIGVFSVVMLIALGLGLKNYLKQQFEDLGANLVMVLPGSGFGGGGFGAGVIGGAEFDERDIRSLRTIRDIEYTVPVFMKSITVKAGEQEEMAYLMGTSEDYFELMGLDIIAGDPFGKSQVTTRSKEVVLGGTIAKNLFEEADKAVRQSIRINNQRYKVIGVTETMGDPQADSTVALPYTTTFGSLNPDKTFFAIYLGVSGDDQVEKVKDEATKVLSERYGEDDFSVTEQSQILDTVNQIFNIVNGILIAIGSISLLVGGIGIMNIMYASVTERTKEVGIRRAVGATEKDILLQFLTESVILSVLGGVLGLLLAGLAVLGVRQFFPATINALAVIITFGISSAIGIFFGVFPARRAASLPPIEAIRYE